MRLGFHQEGRVLLFHRVQLRHSGRIRELILQILDDLLAEVVFFVLEVLLSREEDLFGEFLLIALRDGLDVLDVLHPGQGIVLEARALQIIRDDDARFVHPVGLPARHVVDLWRGGDGESVGGNVFEVVIVAFPQRALGQFLGLDVYPGEAGEAVGFHKFADQIAIVVD